MIMKVSKKYIGLFAVGFNKVDIAGRDFFLSKGGKMVKISNREINRWKRAVKPVIADYKKDVIAKGYSARQVNSWLRFVRKRIKYWSTQERRRKIPTPFR